MRKRSRIVIKPRGEENSSKPKRIKNGFGQDMSGKQVRYLIVAVLGVVLLLMSVFFFLRLSSEIELEPSLDDASVQQKSTDSFWETAGIERDLYDVKTDVFRVDTKLYSVLKEEQLETVIIEELCQKAKRLDIINLKLGQNFYRFYPKDTTQHNPLYVYQKNLTEYIVLRPYPLAEVKLYKHSLSKQMREVGLIIKTNLWDDGLLKNIPPKILRQVDTALQWTVDLYHISPGDRFKLVYEEYTADGEVLDVGKLKAVYFEDKKQDYTAYYLKGAKDAGYFDNNGRPMVRQFLMSPLKYGRISSAYNPDRIHPVDGVKRPHFGTDYAAPMDTPIRSVADGKVTIANHTTNNGNYIKIRHDKTYETQYLHMNSFAKGIKKGSRVKQGQTIGYVGQTGKATGPHVCFRFWKDRAQVNHLKEKLPQAATVSLRDEELFLTIKDSLNTKLERIEYVRF